MKNKIISYRNKQLSKDILKRLNDAYCQIFNVRHFMIHPVTGHIIGLKTVFGTEDVPMERMYNAPEVSKRLKKGYVFYHHPHISFEKLRQKCFSVGYKPYLTLLQDPRGSILGFMFGVEYPSFFEMLFHEGWLNRFHYSNVSPFSQFDLWVKQVQNNEKLIANMREVLASADCRPDGRFFSPNALAIIREFRNWEDLATLNDRFFNALEPGTRKIPFVFETTVGTRIHDFLTSNGWIAANGTLASPHQEKPNEGDSVIIIGNYSLVMDRYVPSFHLGSATFPN